LAQSTKQTHSRFQTLRPISESERVLKNTEFILRGSHKSTIKYEPEYEKIVQAEVKQGWMIPLPIDYIHDLKHGELAPVGIDGIKFGQKTRMSQKRLNTVSRMISHSKHQ
jgi:hypothetical protein